MKWIHLSGERRSPPSRGQASVASPTKVVAPVWGVIALIIAFILIIIIQKRVEAVIEREQTDLELLYIPPVQALHSAALGDDNTAADLLWLRSVFYIASYHHRHYAHCGEQKTPGHIHKEEEHIEFQPSPRDPTDKVDFAQTDLRHNPALKNLLSLGVETGHARQLYNLLQIATDLDPRFTTPYFEGALNLSIIGGRFVEALALLEKGLRNRPDRWELHYYRGFIKLFYLNDKTGAAADIKNAALKPDAPLIVIQLAAAMQVGLGQTDMAVEFLRSLSEITHDAQLKAKLDAMVSVYEQRLSRKLDRSRQTQVGGLLEEVAKGLTTQ